MQPTPARTRPIIGITSDTGADGSGCQVSRAYVDAVADAGGLPIVLPARPDLASSYAAHCDGFVLTGGDDPIMEHWGIATHPRARKVAAIRQEFELAMLESLDRHVSKPVLGICLGMQYMALHGGASLDQYLPDTLATHAMHWGKAPHDVDGELGCGPVLSNHRQAVVATRSAGSATAGSIAAHFRIVATAPDGVVEAVQRDDRPFYLGVQWHPERTDDRKLGRDLFARLVESSSR